jgi:phthiodiolone/phenolphthiodiolone dimycocerosates ketoreductase
LDDCLPDRTLIVGKAMIFVRRARRIALGLQLGTQPPMAAVRAYALCARALRLDSLMVVDHFQNVFPTAVWDRQFTWLAAQRPSPHELYDYQVLLGYLAPRVGRMRLGVGVTEAIRRHPVLIAQSMLTLSHLTRRAPILGIGAGERLNVDPYGLDFSRPVSRLEEALQIVRLCLTSQGPITFAGEHFRLDGAVMDLAAPPGRTPEIWVAGHGPRMLRLTGKYGDGWYPTSVVSPEEYAQKWDVVRAAARDVGRDPDAITPALHRFLVVGDSADEVRALLASPPVRMFGLAAPGQVWRAAGARNPLGEDVNAMVDVIPEGVDRGAFLDAVAAVPDAVLTGGPLLVGTPDQVIARIREFGDAGARHVVLAPVSGLASKRAALFALRATARIARALAQS